MSGVIPHLPPVFFHGVDRENFLRHSLLWDVRRSGLAVGYGSAGTDKNSADVSRQMPTQAT